MRSLLLLSVIMALATQAQALEVTANNPQSVQNSIENMMEPRFAMLLALLNKVVACNKLGQFFDSAATTPNQCKSMDLSDYTLDFVKESKDFAYMDKDGSNHTKTTKLDFSDISKKRAEGIKLWFAGRAKKGGTKMTPEEAKNTCHTNPIIETLAGVKSTTSDRVVGDGTSRKLYSKVTHTFDDSQYYFFKWRYDSATKTLNITNSSDNGGNMMLYFCKAEYETMQLVKSQLTQ